MLSHLKRPVFLLPATAVAAAAAGWGLTGKIIDIDTNAKCSFDILTQENPFISLSLQLLWVLLLHRRILPKLAKLCRKVDIIKSLPALLCRWCRVIFVFVKNLFISCSLFVFVLLFKVVYNFTKRKNSETSLRRLKCRCSEYLSLWLCFLRLFPECLSFPHVR